MPINKLLSPIMSFLKCETPQSWIDEAKRPENLPELLIDHCNCELKAAQTAMFLVRKYAVDKPSSDALLGWVKPYEAFIYSQDRDVDSFLNRDNKKNDQDFELVFSSKIAVADELTQKMLRLIKEEFHHFEQVLEIMTSRGLDYSNIRAGRYAKGMMKHVKTHEPQTLIDKLIIGAFIEARSCERFAKLAPHLDDELAKFYISLLRSEARHFQDYLVLAQKISTESIDERVSYFADVEAELIQSVDDEFRFHSGAPQ